MEASNVANEKKKWEKPVLKSLNAKDTATAGGTGTDGGVPPNTSSS